LFLQSSTHNHTLHSFPTRRSSDLIAITSELSSASASKRVAQSFCSQSLRQAARALNAELTSPAKIAVAGSRVAILTYRHAQIHRSEEHTSELQSRSDLVCRLLLEK